MDIMEAVKYLTEEQFLDMLFIVYCMGYPEYAIDNLKKSDNGKRIKQKIKARVEDWLEI